MNAPAAATLILYSIQVLIVVTAAALASRALSVPTARGRLMFWRLVVIACLALPLLPAAGALSEAAANRAVIQRLVLAAQPIGHDRSSYPWTLVPLVLLIGVGLRTAWLVIGLITLRQMRRSSSGINLDADLAALVRSVAPSAGVRSHASIAQPMTFGIHRPIILLPRRLLDLPSGVQRAAVLHEAFHVARYDWISLLVEEAVKTVCWFHPAIWWAVDRVQLAREEVVDELVIQGGNGRHAYLTALLSFSDVLPAVLATPFYRQHHLSHRIKMLRTPNCGWSLRAVLSASVLIAITTCSTVGAASLRPGAAQTQDAAQTIYEPGDGVTLPAPIKQVRPEYTGAAKDARIEGSVLLECAVMTDGRAGQIRVIKSLDTVHGLDDAAVDALRQWEFRPGAKDGKAVAVRVHVEMTFTLK